MGIIDRLSTLIRSNINDLISRAENPQKVLEQLIVDMRSQLAKAKQQVAAAIADEKRLSAQAEQEKKLSEDWESFFSCSACADRRFSSAMAAATCCLAFANWLRMSTISCSRTFCGFSAREIRSLMFDRISVDRRSMIPI